MTPYIINYITVLGIRTAKVTYFYTERKEGYSLGIIVEPITETGVEHKIFLMNSFFSMTGFQGSKEDLLNKVKENLEMFRQQTKLVGE